MIPKKQLIAGITFLAGLYYLLNWLLPASWTGGKLGDAENTVGPFLQVVAAFSIGLGWFQLLAIQGRNLTQGPVSQRVNAVAFHLTFWTVLVVGLYVNVRPTELPNTAYAAKLWELLFNDVVVALGSAVFSLLAFFIVAAAYRAFRVRNLEAGLMMAAAFVVMLGQVPVGGWMLSWFPGGSAILPKSASWLMTVIAGASLRAIGFGVAVGAIAMGLRIWLSLERGSYFEREA
ncbi:MAG TPA: hypothetical protein VGN26_14635 [Armatimonadota bacterium]|jgi:hypothetical protein